MIALRRPLIGLIVLFAGAAVLDRLGSAQAGNGAMGTYAYVVAAAMAAAPFVFPGLRRARPWVPAALALAVYAVVAWIAGAFDGPDTYAAFTGAAFAALSALLAQRTAAALDEIEEVLGTVVFGESPALPLDAPRAANEILGEMARSRRHDRPLTVTVISPDPASLHSAIDDAHEDVQRAMRARYVHGELGRTIAAQLRRSDLLFEDPQTGRFVILSPETGPDGIGLLVARIREATGRTRVRLAAGSASFPHHALTFEQLVEKAQQSLEEPAEPEPLDWRKAATRAEGVA